MGVARRRTRSVERAAWAVLSAVSVAVAGAGFALVFAAAHDVPRLRAPSTAAERGAGVVRGRATFHPEGATPVPPCVAQHEKDGNTVTSRVNGDNRVDFDDGARYVLPESATVEFFDGNFPNGPAPELAVAYARKKPPETRHIEKIGCLRSETHVWVEACARGRELHGCPETSGHVLITLGGADVRAATFIGRALGWLFVAVAAALVASFSLARAFAVPDGPVDALARTPPGFLRGALGIVVLAGAPLLGAPLALAAWLWSSYPWPLAGCAGVLAVVVLRVLLGRLRALVLARRALVASEGARLRDRDDGARRVLEVRVPADAPMVDALSGPARYACVRLQLKEIVDGSDEDDTHTRWSGVEPSEVPIEDDSGRGTLVLAHCDLDAPDEPGLPCSKASSLPEWFAGTAASVEPLKGHKRFVVESRVLLPGEPLVVIGFGDLARPGEADGAAGYRDAQGKPRIGGDAEERALAHVGTRATLTRAVSVELAAATAALTLAAAAPVAAVLLARWLMRV